MRDGCRSARGSGDLLGRLLGRGLTSGADPAADWAGEGGEPAAEKEAEDDGSGCGRRGAGRCGRTGSDGVEAEGRGEKGDWAPGGVEGGEEEEEDAAEVAAAAELDSAVSAAVPGRAIGRM